MIELSDCTLEPLHEDGELILYRAAHASPADWVAPSVLVVGPAGEYVSPATLARLENEYALAAELDPRWAVRRLGLDRYRGRAGTPMEVGAFLRMGISIARAVDSLHAAGLIHKNIKPANVLVNSATGDAWLTGFGIASRLRRERQSREPPEIIAVRALLKKSDVDRTQLDLGQVIRDVLALVQSEMARHRIVLRTSLADDLPPVLGDRIELQQVVLNLLTNAIEAMRDVEGRRRGLLISARRDDIGPDAGVLVAVEDAGVGFEGASVDQLFETLYTTKPDGLGMGLSISQSIIRSHGGRLWGTPNAGHGATFQFVLPAWIGQTPCAGTTRSCFLSTMIRRCVKP